MLPIWKPITINFKRPKPKGYPYKVHTLADAIKQKRLDERLSKVQLAKILDVVPMSIWKWEDNNIQPVPRMLKRIINWLGYIPPLKVDKNTLGGQLYIYRVVHGYEQEEIAKMLRMDNWAVCKIEKNEFAEARYIAKIKSLLKKNEVMV